MFRHVLSYFLFSVGIAGFMFALGRTYYLVWKMRKERESRGSLREGREIKAEKDSQLNQRED